MVKSILSTLLFMSMSPLWAQLTEGDTLRFGYRVNVNGSWITGNVERLLINSNLELSHGEKKIGIKSSNSYIYGTIFKRETENDMFSRNFFYLNPRNRFYPYAMLWLQNSKRQQINFRSQAGLGVSYALVSKGTHHVKVSGTITREETYYDGTNFFIIPENLEMDRVKNWRGTIRVLGNHVMANGKVKIHYETWYQPSLNDTENWRYFMNASLDVPISKHFSFRTAFLYNHDNIVLASIKRDDKIMTFGINWSNF